MLEDEFSGSSLVLQTSEEGLYSLQEITDILTIQSLLMVYSWFTHSLLILKFLKI